MPTQPADSADLRPACRAGDAGPPGGRATPAASLPFPAQRVPENPFAASVVAVDADGLGVACNFTMNALFGAGRIAQGTGIILAPAPSDRGFGFSALAPMIMANNNNGELYYASAASGGMAGVLAQAELFYAVTRGEIAAGSGDAAAARLSRRRSRRGLSTMSAATTIRRARWRAPVTRSSSARRSGRVNAIYCPRGTPSDPDSCQLRNDYRGNGLATLVSGK